MHSLILGGSRQNSSHLCVAHAKIKIHRLCEARCLLCFIFTGIYIGRLIVNNQPSIFIVRIPVLEEIKHYDNGHKRWLTPNASRQLSALITLNMQTLSCHAQCILIVEINPLRSYDLASRQYHETSIKTARTQIWIIVRSNAPIRSPSPISSKAGHTGIPASPSPY